MRYSSNKPAPISNSETNIVFLPSSAMTRSTASPGSMIARKNSEIITPDAELVSLYCWIRKGRLNEITSTA